jgi:hypothetical protein
VPAPAVIPAPIAYTKVVAVETLVVGLQGAALGRSASDWRVLPSAAFPLGCGPLILTDWGILHRAVYLEKIRVFNTGILALNRLAWDNGTRRLSVRCFVGFGGRSND